MFGDPCLICGPGEEISKPFAMIEYVPDVQLTCGTLQSIGVVGLICPDPDMLDLADVCGCVDMDTPSSRSGRMSTSEYAELIDLRSIYDIPNYRRVP
jgi:hypothetical protein